MKKSEIYSEIIDKVCDSCEVLVDNGINIICDDQMRMTLSDEDAEIIRDCTKTLGISSSEVIHELILIRAYEENMS